MFKPVETTDPNIDAYWRLRLLYVKNSGCGDRRYELDETYRPDNECMAPSRYHPEDYEYALLLEE